MSRIGKLPITVPKGVTVTVQGEEVVVKGPKGELATPIHPLLKYDVAAAQITITREDDSREARAQHGLRRTLLANCVAGVTAGFVKTLEVIGVGYKVAVKGSQVELSLGFSHPVVIDLPKGIAAEVEGQKLKISGIDKVLVGEIAAKIRRLRKPEPYKGKGIKYENEHIHRKVGKSGTKK